MNVRIVLCLLLYALAAAQSPEAVVLGGSCFSEDSVGIAVLDWHSLVNRHGEALRRGDREAAVGLAKQIVRSRCSNEHWWLTLAESLAELGRLEECVAALQALYERGSNSVDARLRTPNSALRRLLKSDTYERSMLATKLTNDRRALDQRRTEARDRLDVGPRPPVAYIAKHACPFECCGFGAWSVTEDTALYDRPGGTRIIGNVSKGERVEVSTGEVHLRPLPVRVRFSSPYGFTAEEGSIVYLLDYLGEGLGRVWAQGSIIEAEILSVRENCAFPGPHCWGEFIFPEDDGRQRDGVWWVKVKTRSGTVGWTRETDRFGGIDGCG